MPEFTKNGRFWLALVMMVIVGVAVLLGKVDAKYLEGGFVGFLLRFGGGGLAEKVVEVAKGVKLPPASTLLLVLALPLLVGGCGLTPLQQLKTATDGAYEIETVVIPRWNASCEAAATKCKADGITVADKCDLLRSCQRDRGYLVKSLAGVHTGVVMAAPLVGLGKGSEAAKYITASLRALHNASLIAQKSGFLGGGK